MDQKVVANLFQKKIYPEVPLLSLKIADGVLGIIPGALMTDHKILCTIFGEEILQNGFSCVFL